MRETASARGARCTACGLPTRVALDEPSNTERRNRGVTVLQWFDAPHTPARREDCSDGPRPCPHFRCRHFVRVGAEASCSLDVAQQPRFLDDIAALLDVTRERARQLERDARRAAERAARELVR